MELIKKIKIPSAYSQLCEPSRYKIFYGGRGSAKSWAFARVLLAIALSRCIRVMCCRQFHSSLYYSVLTLLENQIRILGLSNYYCIYRRRIISCNGSMFQFHGLERDSEKIKSMESIDIVWVEEAQSINQKSLEILIPTIRKPNSELWFTYNPYREDDPIHQLMLSLKRGGEGICRKVTWRDNPWFSKEMEEERIRLRDIDLIRYNHIWEGECLTWNDSLIFHDKIRIESFNTPDTCRFYYGVDWGFARDPTAIIRCFVTDECLFIDQEIYGWGVEIDHLPDLFMRMPGSREWPLKADAARPETISYMKRQGWTIEPSAKWPGSVADGIAALRRFPVIVVHPRCKHLIEEFRHYSWKVERMSGTILSQPEDNWNHGIDALRYALEDQICGKDIVLPDWDAILNI